MRNADQLSTKVARRLHAEMGWDVSGSLRNDNDSEQRTSDIEMASWNTEVYEQLMQMGIDVPIVQEASRRFQDIERAVNWAFDHGQTWLADNNNMTTGGFGPSTSEADLLGKGPPQHTHNNSPNVSPLMSAQPAANTDVEDLRDVDMTGINATDSAGNGPPPPFEEAGSLDPFGNNIAQKLHKTYSKKARTSFGEGVSDVRAQQKTPSTTNRPLPPPPPLNPFDTQEFRIEGESEEDQIQRAIRMSLGQADSPFTNVPLTHPSTQHAEYAANTEPAASEAMETDLPGYDESDPNRRLRASAPPPEFTEAEKGSGIQLGSNNPFKAAEVTSAERSVTFAKVPDDTMDQGNSSLVATTSGVDSSAPRILTAQEQEDADLQAALSASLSENLPGGFAGAAVTSSTAGATPGGIEGAEELDMDPEGKTLFDEGQRNVPMKQEGAPIAITVLWDNALYAANILQCLMATPQFRTSFASFDLSPETDAPTDNPRLRALVTLARFLQNSSNAYVTSLLGMNTLFDVAPSSDVARSAGVFLLQVVETWLQTETPRPSDDVVMTDESTKKVFNPLFLSRTTLLNTSDSKDDAVTSYTINYSASTGNTITECIAAELWSESPNRFFSSLGDILPITITRGAKNVWGDTKPLIFEEDLYMDRFLATNASKVAQIRGNEGLSKKKIENLQEEQKKWTTHKSTDISATLDRTLKHFERKAEATSDEKVKAEVMTVLEKLRDAGASITARKEAIQKELEEEQQKSKDCWDQLDIHKERYTLRGVCFYAGWIARSSMFCYVKGSQGDWWKVCDTAVEPATFEQIKEDRTGLYFDSGAYLLVYARQGEDAIKSEGQEQTVKMEVDADVPESTADSSPSAANAEQEVKEEHTSTVDITLT